MFPPNVRFPSTLALPVIFNEEPDIPPNTALLPVPAIANVTSPPSKPICNVCKSVFTYGSPNANEPDFWELFPRLNLSAI